MTIIFPLKSRVKHRGATEHIAAGLGAAIDYAANFESLYSPVDGIVYLFQEIQGGNWIRVTDAEGRQWEMAHLSERLVKTGDHVKAGQLIGKTGNSGTLTTGPHLHLQVKLNGVRLDPEPLLINAPLAMSENHTWDNKVVRIGTPETNYSPLIYAVVIRGKKHIFSEDNKAVILVLDKLGLVEIPRITPTEAASLPNSAGLAF